MLQEIAVILTSFSSYWTRSAGITKLQSHPNFFYVDGETVVGRGGLEPPMSSGTGFTVRCGTNYALPTQMSVLTIHMWCFKPLNYPPASYWQAGEESNPHLLMWLIIIAYPDFCYWATASLLRVLCNNLPTRFGGWCGIRDSDPWPPECKSGALTSWANPT